MENITNITNIETSKFTAIAIVGSAITSLIGGWDRALQTLLIFMAIDYISGLVVAGVFKKSNKTESGGLGSRAGWEGIFKKVMTLFLVLMGNQLDLLLQVEYVRYGLIIAFMIDEGMSIIENAGLMGIPIPKLLSDSFDILRKKEEVKQ
ncbi:phage holin family protein [Tissierella sp. MB52-C2]|uniref:phage holin family protein n=1 Tax=Tissierella sp. MB52-C2 TaxID=3070999 RepID=UPI00280B481B|nr:phage holin family protein [Tissierella sp. MB52-C2]WMM26644.1 phage holin family protein [Tissierella sp. MB52-C2]